MRQETLEHLKRSYAESMRAIIAAPWFMDFVGRQFPRSSARRFWKRLGRAAGKSEGNPVAFMDRYFGLCWFAPEDNLSERGAIAGASIFRRIAHVATQPGGLTPTPEAAHELLTFLRSLAAQPPGRSRLGKYDKAFELFLNGKKSMHGLCLQLEPDYSSKTKEQQHFARDRMRSGINRRLAKPIPVTGRTKLPR
jgi:hypothetical protein